MAVCAVSKRMGSEQKVVVGCAARTITPSPSCWGLNPRPRAAGDHVTTRTAYAGKVSIHAPARGATLNGLPPRASVGSFNPRPRAAGDSRSRSVRAQAAKFQSTPPRGGRRRERLTRTSRNLFQSTPPRGGRLHTHTHRRALFQFQSTPPRGGRHQVINIDHTAAQRVSIHAPARRATVALRAVQQGSRCFNPRPRAAGDRGGAKCFLYRYLERRFREPDRLNVLTESTLPIR